MVTSQRVGDKFEQRLIKACEQYRERGMALIDKTPNNWQVIRRGKEIVSAYAKGKSTVDFIGISHGRAIAFEAKTTQLTTRFNLDMVKEHQVQYLKQFREQGGIAFFLIEFRKHEEVYLVPITDFITYWDHAQKGGAQSIPYADFKFNWQQVKPARGITVDFLKEIS